MGWWAGKQYLGTLIFIVQFITPWNDTAIAKADGEALFSGVFNADKNCYIAQATKTAAQTPDQTAISWVASDCLDKVTAAELQARLDSIAGGSWQPSKAVFAICEIKSCTGCIFPFILGGRK